MDNKTFLNQEPRVELCVFLPPAGPSPAAFWTLRPGGSHWRPPALAQSPAALLTHSGHHRHGWDCSGFQRKPELNTIKNLKNNYFINIYYLQEGESSGLESFIRADEQWEECQRFGEGQSRNPTKVEKTWESTKIICTKANRTW